MNSIQYPHAGRFAGVYASTICPLNADGEISHEDLRKHLGHVAKCEGLSGFLLNGHAGENARLSRMECRTVVDIARTIAPQKQLVAGVNDENTDEAIAKAKDAADAGADCIMIFAPFSWSLGLDPRAVFNHHKAIHDAVDLPVMLFQGSVHAGQMRFDDPLLKSLLSLPHVVAIKEGSWETSAYERTRSVTSEVRPDVAVMASGDEHLFPCFVLGSQGSLVSLAAIIPDLIVKLEKAVRAADLEEARAVHARIYPLSRAIYAQAPSGLVTARIKACLMLMGHISTSNCKPPVGLLEETELHCLGEALHMAGLPDRRHQLA